MVDIYLLNRLVIEGPLLFLVMCSESKSHRPGFERLTFRVGTAPESTRMSNRMQVRGVLRVLVCHTASSEVDLRHHLLMYIHRMHIGNHPWFCTNLAIGVLVRNEASEVQKKLQVQDIVGADIMHMTLTAYQPH